MHDEIRSKMKIVIKPLVPDSAKMLEPGFKKLIAAKKETKKKHR
jgi:hypothetical protein